MQVRCRLATYKIKFKGKKKDDKKKVIYTNASHIYNIRHYLLVCQDSSVKETVQRNCAISCRLRSRVIGYVKGQRSKSTSCYI